MAGLLSDIARWFRGETRTAPGVGSALPRYVERDDDWCRCHPGELKEVTAWLFPLKAGKKELQDLCDDLFYFPSRKKVNVTPLYNGVVIGMMEYKHASSPSEPDWGYLAYNEAAVFVPVRLKVEEGKEKKIDRFAAAIPYMFVDRFSPTVTGLESFGFPKRCAKLDFKLNHWCVRADVVPRSAEEIIEQEVLKISGSFQENQIMFSEDTLVSARLQAIAEIIVEQLESFQPLERIKVGAFNEVAVVLLKQFRDATDPKIACHQSIVQVDFEVPMKPSLLGFKLVGELNCYMPEYYRPKMAQKLGFTEKSIGLGVRMKLDFNLKSGMTLWP